MTKMEKRRREKGYTQQYMAKNTNISIGCYNMYENNQRKIPISKALAIANVLECEIEDIFLPFTFTNCETTAKEIL